MGRCPCCGGKGGSHEEWRVDREDLAAYAPSQDLLDSTLRYTSIVYRLLEAGCQALVDEGADVRYCRVEVPEVRSSPPAYVPEGVDVSDIRVFATVVDIVHGRRAWVYEFVVRKDGYIDGFGAKLALSWRPLREGEGDPPKPVP